MEAQYWKRLIAAGEHVPNMAKDLLETYDHNHDIYLT